MRERQGEGGREGGRKGGERDILGTNHLACKAIHFLTPITFLISLHLLVNDTPLSLGHFRVGARCDAVSFLPLNIAEMKRRKADSQLGEISNQMLVS